MITLEGVGKSALYENSAKLAVGEDSCSRSRKTQRLVEIGDRPREPFGL